MKSRRLLPRARLAALITLPLLTACDSLDQEPALSLVLDSAGIRVIENLHRPADVPLFATLDPMPVTEIGVVSGNPDQEFGWIKTAAYLPPDRILVADGQARQLSVFNLDGNLLARLGGNGEGPGEFQTLSHVQALGTDSVAVWDGRARRITVLPMGGTDPLTISLEGEAASGIRSVQFLGDGTLIASRRPSRDEIRQYPEPTLVQDSVLLSHLSRSGEKEHRVGTFFSSTRILQLTVDGSIVRTSEATPAFPRFSNWVCSSDRIIIGDNRSFGIDWFDFKGNLVQRMIAPGLEISLDPEVASRVMERRIEAMGGTPEIRRQVEGIFEDFPLPEKVPSFTKLLLDDLGFLWVQEYHEDWKQQATWYVFSPSGELAGRVSFPPGATVWTIDEEYVLLSPLHELDVPVVQLFRLNRQQGP